MAIYKMERKEKVSKEGKGLFKEQLAVICNAGASGGLYDLL